MAALSESNSLKTWPMCLIAMIDGESGAFNPTERAAPTTSSCGAKMLVNAAMRDPEQQDAARRVDGCCARSANL